MHAWADAQISEFRAVPKALAGWLPEILAFHRCNPVTNGRLEGTNNKLGVLKRIAYLAERGGLIPRRRGEPNCGSHVSEFHRLSL